MAESTTSDSQLRWIYEGPKSLVNREDYLLGKKVDKNFELYSDAVVKEKESGIEAVEKPHSRINDTSSKISNLEVDIVRTEDPLVAIKMKEERIRLEKMENPLTKLKMQKLLKKAMEKKERKRLKKLQKLEKRKKKHKKILAGTDDDERKDESEQYHDDAEKSAQVPSTSQGTSKTEKERHGKKLQRDSHIPEHLRPKYSSSSEGDDDDEDKKIYGKPGSEKYGLMKKLSREVHHAEEVLNPFKNIPKIRCPEPYKKTEKRKLTEEEMEAKRLEMMENANWRDKVRVRNIKKNAQHEEEEDRQNEGKTANFIRPMLNNAASTMTIERQLHSHRRGLQKTGSFTDNFTKR